MTKVEIARKTLRSDAPSAAVKVRLFSQARLHLALICPENHIGANVCSIFAGEFFPKSNHAVLPQPALECDVEPLITDCFSEYEKFSTAK